MGIVETIKNTVVGWIANPTNYNTMFHTVKQVMTFSDTPQGGVPITDASIIQALINITAPIAMIIMVLYFLITLFVSVSNEREPDIHIFWKAGILLILADITLTHTPEIIGNVMGLSNAVLNQMSDTIDTLSNTSVTPEANVSLIALVVLLFVTMIGKLVSIVGTVIVFIVCVSAKIELLVRFAFAPIGFATIAGEHRPGESLRFLKKLFASCFYCGAIVVAMYIACAQTTTFTTSIDLTDSNILTIAITYVTNCFYSMAMPLAAAGSISTAKSIINEAFGI